MKLKPGTWVKFREDVNIEWNLKDGRGGSPIPPELKNVIFVVVRRGPLGENDIELRPHEIFSGLLTVTADGRMMKYRDTLMYPWYYESELEVVENFDD